MGVYEGRGQLSRAIKDLRARWLDAKTAWDDANSERFEEKYIVPLEMDLKMAVSAMDTMAALLSQARHDCEE
jgi:hypothetical protein